MVSLGALSARAEGGDFPSVVGGTTVAPRENVLEFGLGHSDAVSVGWRHGVSSAVEFGVGASGTFGYRGLLFMGGGDVSGSALGPSCRAAIRPGCSRAESSPWRSPSSPGSPTRRPGCPVSALSFRSEGEL